MASTPPKTTKRRKGMTPGATARKPRKPPNLTPEQRAASSERMRNIACDTSRASAAMAQKQERLAHAAVEKVESDGVQTEALDKIKQELASRELAKRELLGLVLRHEPQYQPGWVHRDISEKLSQFMRDVEEKKSPRLILTVPPRHGKSLLASQYFPAWVLGHHPEWEFIATSHTATLAEKFSRRVREVLRSKIYQVVFNKTELDPDSQSVQQWSTTKGGGLLAAGVGGAILGSGAHCLPLWAEVMTPTGPQTVDSLVKNVDAAPEVLSYDGKNVVRRKINGCITRESDHYYEVETSTGEFYATGEHPVCVGAEGGVLAYRRVDDLRSGDRVLSVAELASWREALRQMPSVRGGVHATPVEVSRQHAGARATGAHVFDRLSGAATQLANFGKSGVRRVWGGVLGARERRGQASEEHVLQQRVSGQAPGANLRGGEQPPIRAAGSDLRVLWEGVSAQAISSGSGTGSGRAVVLQPGMLRRVTAWSPYQPEQTFPWGALLPARVQESEGRNAGDPDSVCGVRGGSEGFAPSGRRQGEQRVRESGTRVPELPLGASPSIVIRVTRVDAPLTVADFEVDETHCFITPTGNVLLNCLLIDDPVKNAEQAGSEGSKEAIWEWFATTAYTRLAPGGGVIVIMQRWAEDDLAGLLERGGPDGEGDKYTVIRYPAIAEEDEAHRKAGEALHPERYPLAMLEAIKSTLSPWMWSALYQQRPTVQDGDYFTKDMIVYYDDHELPEQLTHYGAWDFAISKKERADRTVGIAAGLDEHDDLWVTDIEIGRWKADEIVERILDLWERHPFDVMGGEEGQIKLALGPYLEQRAQERRMYDFALEPLKPGRRDKESRARTAQALMRRRKIRLPRNHPRIQEVVDELLAFPNGVHDDACVARGTWVAVPGGQRRIEDVRVGDLVETPAGPRRVIAAEMTNPAAEVFELVTHEGHRLVATGNHPVYSPSEGFVRLDALTYMSDIQCLKPSNMTVPAGTATPKLISRAIASIFSATRRTALHLCTSIAMFGSKRTGRSPMGSTSTTKMETRQTTSWGIWNSWIARHTSRPTRRRAGESAPTSRERISPTYVLWHRSGIGQRRGADGTPRTENALGQTASIFSVLAKNVALRIRRGTRNLVFAGIHAKRVIGGDDVLQPQKNHNQTEQKSGGSRHRLSRLCVYVAGLSSRRSTRQSRNTAVSAVPVAHVERVTRLDQRAEVYNLTVEDQHVYYANGVLTHNCDAIAYLCLMLNDMVFRDDKPRDTGSPTRDQSGYQSRLAKILARMRGRRERDWRAA